MDVVVESILRHGFNGVITADRKTGEIVAGHTRYWALLALGQTQGPLVFADWDDDPAGPSAFMIVDNESGRMARMDEFQEAKLLMFIRDNDKGLMGTGFDDEKLTKLLAKLAREDDEDIGHHFGKPHEDMPLEIFQVVLTFESAVHRDEVAADLAQVYENVRVVDL